MCFSESVSISDAWVRVLVMVHSCAMHHYPAGALPNTDASPCPQQYNYETFSFRFPI